MRTISLLPILAAAAGIHAASWTALPELPRGSAGYVSGDGNGVAFTNGLGGTSYHSPISSVAPWIKLRASANSMSVLVRKNLIAYLVNNGMHNGVEYGALGDSVLKTAFFSNTIGPLSGIDQDGRHILAIRSGSNFTPSLHLSVDSVVTDPVFAKGVPAGTMHAWRLLKMPSEFSKYGTVIGRIEGRLIVASNTNRSFLSRDTGATWTTSTIPYLSDCDISGDTIVGMSFSSNRLQVSIDAGATWDSSALNGALGFSFRGGKLYGLLWQSDTTYDLVSSANLGKSWNTILEEVNSINYYLAWDGSALWVTKHDALLRSSDEGRTWTVGDSGLGETVISKLRGFGNTLLVLQALKYPDTYDIPFHRLWAFDGTGWTLVRDSVTDFEVMETDTGRAVFVLADTGSVWRERPNGAKLRLERSYNLKSWQVMPGLAPYSVALGMSKRGLLVGQKHDVAIFTRGSRVVLDSAWKVSYGRDLGRRGFLVEQDEKLAWGEYGQMFMRRDTQEVLLTTGVKAYATLGSKYGYRIMDTASSWLADFAQMATTYPFLKPTIASGVAVLRDSIATWNGSDTFALMRPEGERRVLGPEGKGVTQVDYVSMSALGSLLTVIDSTYVVADLRGRIWRFDKYGSVGVGPSHPRSAPLSLRRGGLSLELARDAKVRIERFDALARSLEVVVDGILAQGRHLFPLSGVSGVSFAVVTIDGIRQQSLKILPSGM